MQHRFGRARGLTAALVVLALSAGAALAGGEGPPPAADVGLDVAGAAAGHTVPAGQTVPVRADADALQEVEGDGEAEADQQLDGATGMDNHGALVSEAAQMEAPEGFDTHGQFVSCVARMNRGHLGPDADLSTLVLADLTPDDCDGDPVSPDGAAEAQAGADSTADGPGRSAEAKARNAARGAHGNAAGH